MAMETALSSVVALRLNCGIRESTGTMITRTANIRNVDVEAEASDIFSVVVALAPVIGFPILNTERRIVSRIEP